MSEIIRCPYCVQGFDFRAMIAHIDGKYICGKCGHTAHPGNLGFHFTDRESKLPTSRSTIEKVFLKSDS